jgi:hypothetical protein
VAQDVAAWVMNALSDFDAGLTNGYFSKAEAPARISD